VLPFDDEAEAVRLVNDTFYVSRAACGSLTSARPPIAKAIRGVVVWVNC